MLRGDRTLYWPRQRLLAVADVHVGKTESLRNDGVAVPDGAMFDDLVRLSAAIEDTGAERLVVIGDLVHDARGLTPMVREFIARWRRTCPCRLDLVLGNHDRRVPEMPLEWKLQVSDPCLSIGPLAFCHDEPLAGTYTLVGHIHPRIHISGAGDGVNVPCFHICARSMTLPAFSTLTAGMTVYLEPGQRAVALVQGYVVLVGKL